MNIQDNDMFNRIQGFKPMQLLLLPSKTYDSILNKWILHYVVTVLLIEQLGRTYELAILFGVGVVHLYNLNIRPNVLTNSRYYA